MRHTYLYNKPIIIQPTCKPKMRGHSYSHYSLANENLRHYVDIVSLYPVAPKPSEMTTNLDIRMSYAPEFNPIHQNRLNCSLKIPPVFRKFRGVIRLRKGRFLPYSPIKQRLSNQNSNSQNNISFAADSEPLSSRNESVDTKTVSKSKLVDAGFQIGSSYVASEYEDVHKVTMQIGEFLPSIKKLCVPLSYYKACHKVAY